MNIELKPIAESKVRQLGGDVCGVLVRTDDGVMAVSEHGRCTRLDAGVMGPVSNVPASDRDEFEAWFSDNHVRPGETVNLQMKAYMWVGFQAARAQGGRGAEVVAWEASAPSGKRLFHDKAKAEMSAEVYGGGARPLVYGDTQPQPAVPEGKERLTEIYRREATRLFHELNNLRSEYHNRTAELETEIEDLQEELQRIRRQPAVPEGYPDCDTCGGAMDYMPWHYATETDRHLHACNECWPKVNPATPHADGRIDHQCELCGHKWSSNDLMDDCVVCTKPAGQEGA